MKYILGLLLFAFTPFFVFAVDMCEVGSVSPDGFGALPITHKANAKVPYSDARPRAFSMIVFHDPGSSQCDPIAMLTYGQTYDKKRDGMFGYHFYIARDGTVYQGAPLSKRTNHVSGSYRRTKMQYSNSSAIGISLMCGHMKIPEAQLAAAVRLGHMLQVAYGIPSARVFGHGELQYNRLPNEGIVAARATRTTPADGHDVLTVKRAPSDVRICAIDGTVPTPCSGQSCEVFASASQKTIQGLPPGLYKILTGNSGYEIPKNTLSASSRIPLPKTRDGYGPTSISGSVIDTDARAWGYGEQRAAPQRKSTVDTSTHFSNPLDSMEF